MNNAVFINFDIIDSDAKKQIKKIIAAQDKFCELQQEIELEIGVLEVGKSGSGIAVDLERYDRITEEIRKNLDEIKKAYECLISMNVVELRAAQPPSHIIHQKDQQVH